jgi:hypothetical protein
MSSSHPSPNRPQHKKVDVQFKSLTAGPQVSYSGRYKRFWTLHCVSGKVEAEARFGQEVSRIPT